MAYSSINRVLLIILSSLSSCGQFHYIQQKELAQYPCEENSQNLNVRVKNTGIVPISKFALICNEERILFPGLNQDETSCYKSVPYLYENNLNTYEIYFLKKKRNGKETGNMQRISHIPIVDGDGTQKRTKEEVGYTKYEKGYFTLEVNVSGSRKNKRLVTVSMIEEK